MTSSIGSDNFVETLEQVPRPERLLEAAKCLTTSAMINRVHYAIQNEEWQAAQYTLDDAETIARTLHDSKLACARCFYWHGVVADHDELVEMATEFFIKSLPTMGKTLEGEHLPFYLRKYAVQIYEVLTFPNSREPRSKSKEKQLQMVNNILRIESPPLEDVLTESPAQPNFEEHHAASPTSCSPRDNPEEALHRLVGDEKDLSSPIFQTEVKAGLKERPMAAPGSTVPHSLPEHGLMKPLPMGTSGDSPLTILDRSGTVKDRPRSLLSMDQLLEESARPSPSQPKQPTRSSSLTIPKALQQNGIFRMLSKKILAPVETQKQDHTSEPETPSPLRKASLPGDDMTEEELSEET